MKNEFDAGSGQPAYVHGYSSRESERLIDQATTLAELLHADSIFPPGSRILEAGCGVGAQTVTLAGQNPKARFIAMDIAGASVVRAREKLTAAGLPNVSFLAADLFALPFESETFDHVFVCFVLEHLADPAAALRCCLGVLKTGGTITVIEGDHGSAYFHPDSREARQAIACQVALQARAGGNALIGRQLYPLLMGCALSAIRVSPRMVYADASRPELVEGFTKKTFTAMIEGVGRQALAEGLIDRGAWEKGIADLYRTTQPDGVFCYTFFKAVGRKTG